MIDKLRSIALFATVVEQGSFRGAALHLGLAPSRVSETVSGLEADLGVTLLYRSTRQLSLTQEGRVLFEKAQAMLAAAESGLDAVSPMAGEPRGSLRLTAPAFVTQTELIDRFAAYAKRFPRVDLDIDFSDQPRDLIGGGFDVSIRAGWLEDSAHLARNIGSAERLLVASPDYFAARPTPTHPRDLAEWDWIRFALRPAQTEMIGPDGAKASVLGKSALSVNSASALYEFAARGLGLSVIPEHLACRGFSRGELVHVLPEWGVKPLGFYAVWPDQSRRENLTLHFVRFLADEAPGAKA